VELVKLELPLPPFLNQSINPPGLVRTVGIQYLFLSFPIPQWRTALCHGKYNIKNQLCAVIS
jgi:hypothetical protein